ncbi:related to Structure-specific endonuclease subunit slx1 [Ramularia collo-cygni]|uniref:Related to Structure-specific endonuclease subunit slx1 n=1 Tax=Ramularia collo-cygni TaxID=112498 RepID=A0A2D3V0I7_9PEZI|nr:related to Structure-specific endonuclease subunit slx1 [Ramularia collo-cygni]CZT21288.1 related to Structure-specific endonuclease subunit slx1 [Ramularia collo-cygni]
MEKGIPPIPALYACYLLRSIARHSSTYIGSTPNPPRRLKQHNGESKGGAVRTSRDTLRPWEMTCLVTGFPSKIAALQFEWAWQNPNLTRHISPSSRITQTKQTSRISPRTGKVRKRAARPRLCLTDRLANLHLLLRATSFERWPLKVTFFSEDVHRMWLRWTTQQFEKLRPWIDITMDESSCAPKKGQTEAVPSDPSPKGIHALDLGYTGLKPQIEKCRELFDVHRSVECSICCKETPSTGFGTLVCPHEGCRSVSHLQCLASSFLKAEGASANGAIVPTSGSCPTCNTKLMWIDLVRDLSLRMRGEKEIKAIYKPKRAKKGAAAVDDDSEPVSDDDVPDNVLLEEDG